MSMYPPFTDQEEAPVQLEKLLAQYDDSEPYEVDEGAVFKTTDGKFIGVIVSGCS